MPPVSYKCEWMPNLYDIIAELRRENQTPSAAKTLDMVVVELGQTRDNLRLALIQLEERAVPTGGRVVIDDAVRPGAGGGRGRLLGAAHGGRAPGQPGGRRPLPVRDRDTPGGQRPRWSPCWLWPSRSPP